MIEIVKAELRHLSDFGWPKKMTFAAKDGIWQGTRKQIA